MQATGDARQGTPLSRSTAAAPAGGGRDRRWPLARLRSSIAARLLASVLLFSSAVTLVLTLMQLYVDYRHDVGVIDRRLAEIGRSYLDALGESLWTLDERQLTVQLKGILSLPDIAAVELRETTVERKPLLVALGQREASHFIRREYPIVHALRGTEHAIGILMVEATLTNVYRQLIGRGLIILASQGAKTFVVSLFIIMIAHHLITRHLGAIAAFVGRIDLEDPLGRLSLRRRPPAAPDELDRVVRAVNDMSAGIRHAYGELQTSEQRFRDYAETASDWLWETDRNHDLTYLSEGVARFGFDPAKRLGRPRWDYAADRAEEAAKWQGHFDALVRREAFRDFTFKVVGRDGQPQFVAISGKPVFDPSGAFLGYRGVGSDVTATVEAASALREARDRESRHHAQKMRSEAERLDLLRRLIKAQEDERERIARELHDQTGQDLTGLSLGLKSLESSVHGDEGIATLRWLESLTAQIGSNLHKTAGELRPTSLSDVGLLRALETLVSEWSERFGVKVDFHARRLEHERLGEEIETTVYRVVQEALTNVLKHAAASTVSLVLEGHENSLQIIVEDNGRGFDPDAATARTRLGLAGMRERLALIGGTLSIDSAPGAGTTLYVRVPLAKGGPAVQAVA